MCNSVGVSWSQMLSLAGKAQSHLGNEEITVEFKKPVSLKVLRERAQKTKKT